MGELTRRPGGGSLVQQAFNGPDAPDPGKRTLTEQLGSGTMPSSPSAGISPQPTSAHPAGAVAAQVERAPNAEPPASLHLDPSDNKQPGANTQTGGASTQTKPGDKASGGLGDWAGAGKAGKIFRNATAETFVDSATKETVEIATSWMMAEFNQFELKTNMVMEVERKIHIQLARGGVVIKSRARAFFNADQLPNDVHAALHAPAQLLKHDGAIFVTDDKGMHLLKSFDHPKLEDPSAAALLAHEPMMGYETAPEQRIREADKFVAVTVPAYDNNMLSVEGIMRDAPHAAIGLKNYIKVKLNYEDPPSESLSTARHMIARIEELRQFSWTGYEGTDLLFQLGQMWDGFTKLLQQAETAKPADKHLLDHASDLVVAIGKAGVGVVLAVKEVGLMSRDLGMWGIDKLANVFGYEIDWSAASSIGKAYESGKSTSEIFKGIVDGIIESWTKAIEHAENGDYSQVMNLGAELALDIAIEVVTAGAATPGAAAKRAGTAAQLAEHALVLSEDAVEALARRTETLLQRTKQALRRAPEEARAALLDTIDTVTGWITGLKDSVKIADAGVGTMRVVEKSAITQAIQRSRGARRSRLRRRR